MLRFVVILLVSILLISIVRSIVGMIMHGFSELMKGPSQTPEKARGPEVPVAGELKKDPVCGTYVSTATAFKRSAAGDTIYFCSAECRDRFKG
jgi:YHS domain-containing protein